MKVRTLTRMSSAAAASLLLIVQALALPSPPPELHDVAFRVRLTSDISSKTSKPGDEVTGQVVEPANYKNWLVEGKVNQVKQKGGLAMHKQSELLFSFQTLTNPKGTIVIPVSAQVTTYQNSKGQQNTDDEGNIIQTNKSETLTGAAVGGAAGGAVGGMTHKVKNVLIGGLVGAVAGATVATVGVSGPQISFKEGSLFGLSVSTRKSDSAEQESKK